MENRKLTREPANFSFQYRLGEAEKASPLRNAIVVDHNEGGIRFEARERLPVGTKLKLNFDDTTPAEGEFPAGAEGIVVWSIQPNPEESVFRVGLKYL